MTHHLHCVLNFQDIVLNSVMAGLIIAATVLIIIIVVILFIVFFGFSGLVAVAASALPIVSIHNMAYIMYCWTVYANHTVPFNVSLSLNPAWGHGYTMPTIYRFLLF